MLLIIKQLYQTENTHMQTEIDPIELIHIMTFRGEEGGPSETFVSSIVPQDPKWFLTQG